MDLETKFHEILTRNGEVTVISSFRDFSALSAHGNVNLVSTLFISKGSGAYRENDQK